MSLFGPVLGHLPLLQLPAAKLPSLSGQIYYDFLTQLRHQCIRLAWLQATSSNYDVRALLDLAVGRAHQTLGRSRGMSSSSTLSLEIHMEHARRENELWSCFGFFLENEVEHMLHSQSAGPIVRSVLPADAHTLGIFSYESLLRRLLDRYRENVRTDTLTRETVEFVQMVTGKTACVEELPDAVSAFFDFGDLMRELKSNPELPDGSTTLH